MYEFIGKVRRVGAAKTFSSGFVKRDLVLATKNASGWENVVAFQFKRERATLLDLVKVGDEVRVDFAVDGREWTDPRTNETKVFCDLTGYAVKSADGAAKAPGTKPAPPAIDESEISADVPF